MTTEFSTQPQLNDSNPLETTTQPLTARAINEFVYCPRLFYYEYVEGVFLPNADTLRGEAIHQRVDSADGALPPPIATQQPEPSPSATQEIEAPASATALRSRSVLLGSDTLNIVAKIDLVEAETASGDLLGRLKVCPVDYKAGAPREGEESMEIWEPDKIQLVIQALILRENGYQCDEAIVYYCKTKQRISLKITPELEQWARQIITDARKTAAGPIPPPLVDSPKCIRCSLAPLCLPDETHLLMTHPHTQEQLPQPSQTDKPTKIRRLIAPHYDRTPLYLTTQGLRIAKKAELLVIKDESRTVDEVRIKEISHIALFGNIQLTTQAIQTLCAENIPITYFSTGAWFYGITHGHTLKNVFLRINQFQKANSTIERLHTARKFVHGKIRNQRTLLMRNHIQPPERILTMLKALSHMSLKAHTLDELLGIEGTAAGLYFSQFSGMFKIRDELTDPTPQHRTDQYQLQFNFEFTKRNRRPPTDPVNALLSLGYSLLAKDCTIACLAVGFDPYVGFLHQPRHGRPALALDIMEEFRPLIVDSTVLTVINNRIITADDFVRAGNAVNLTTNGRKKFIEAYERRMNTIITHPLFDYKVCYRRAIELQARILARAITGEIPDYIPLMTR